MDKVVITFKDGHVKEYELKDSLNTTTIDGFIGVVYKKEYNDRNRVKKKEIDFYNTDKIRKITTKYESGL